MSRRWPSMADDAEPFDEYVRAAQQPWPPHLFEPVPFHNELCAHRRRLGTRWNLVQLCPHPKDHEVHQVG